MKNIHGTGVVKYLHFDAVAGPASHRKDVAGNTLDNSLEAQNAGESWIVPAN